MAMGQQKRLATYEQTDSTVLFISQIQPAGEALIFAFHSKGACEARQYAEMVPQMAIAHCAHFSEVWFGARSTARRARKTTLRKRADNGQQWKVRLKSVPVSSAHNRVAVIVSSGSG
jgi:hypothetical protein